MTKKFISISLCILLILSVALMFAGCEEVDTTATAFVFGAHSNFPKLVVSDALKAAIYDSCYSYSNVFVIVSDGEPYMSKKYTPSKLEKNVSKNTRERVTKENLNEIISGLAKCKAKTAENDTLKAIQLAADCLTNTNSKIKNLIIYDSGLCTTGLLNQTKNDYLSASTQSITDNLKDVHALPQLNNINVNWTGIGSVAGEQGELPDSYKYKLEEMWRSILIAGGAKEDSIKIDHTKISADEASDLPKVTAVDFPDDGFDNIDFNEEKDKVIRLDETSVEFIKDSDVFVNPEKARDVLKPLADALAENSDYKVLLAGSTASVGDDVALSLKRAKACRDMLISISPNISGQLECVGLGSKNHSYRTPDTDSNGSLIQEAAQKNRVVFVVNADSKIAKEFKDIGNTE